MNYINQNTTKKVQFVSTILGFILITIILFKIPFTIRAPYYIPTNKLINTGLVISILILIAPRAFIEWSNTNYIREVENQLPLFLRDITNSVQSGIHILQAIENSAQNDYGPLNESLGLTINRISLTSEIEESLIWFGEKLVTPKALRLSYILIEAYNTGGKVEEILETSLNSFLDIIKTRTEREVLVNPYIYIVYLGNFIFLLISWVLLKKFLGSMIDLHSSSVSVISDLFLAEINRDYYWSILFWAAIIESFAGGIFAGKIKYGQLRKGLIYSVILMIITMVFYNSPLFL
jgi:flagellar protein FlaJ